MTASKQRLLDAFKETTKQCRFPGCSTLTVHTYCAKHRPQGEWAIAEQVRDEQEPLQRQEGE